MKMTRILCLILALLMVFSLLAGCGSSDKDDDDEEEKDSTSDVQKDDDKKEDDKNEDASTEQSPSGSTSIKAKMIGTWDMDPETLGLDPDSMEIKECSMTFTASGKYTIKIAAVVEGEELSESTDGEYYFDGDVLMLGFGDGEFDACEVEFVGADLHITDSVGVTMVLTK